MMVPTRDHALIQQWANRHNAIPAQLQQLKIDGQPAILTFLLGGPEPAGPEIHTISWEMFFAQFDLLKLSLAFDEETPRFSIVRVEQRAKELSH